MRQESGYIYIQAFPHGVHFASESIKPLTRQIVRSPPGTAENGFNDSPEMVSTRWADQVEDFLKA